jgi:NADPH:quinone reductase-like Zn-dependent oxidoreductase
VKVVDYQAHQPVHEYLARKYGEQQFDVILDTVGSQGLYENSPGYLKTQGIFVNVGSMEGLLWAIWCWFKNTWRPSFLGGVPRKYCMFSTVFNQETADLIAKYAVEGKLKAAVSETLEMQDALMVCGRTLLLEDADGVSIRATISS